MHTELQLEQTLSPSDELVDFLVREATPQAILRFEASEADQERAEMLIAKLQEGTLTPEEYRDLQRFRAENRLVIALKTRALELLNAS